MSKTKADKLFARVDNILKARIAAVCEVTKLDESTVVRACAEALCDYVESHGSLTFPIKLQIILPEKNRLAKPVAKYAPLKQEEITMAEEGHEKDAPPVTRAQRAEQAVSYRNRNRGDRGDKS